MVQKSDWGRLVARLIRITGDWSLAEDCVQDAIVKAWELWPRTGVPESPGAWLATAAKNRALDRWRRSRVEESKFRLLEAEAAPGVPEPDDRLALLFTCCHPALPLEGRVALTLRTVAGLSTGEVARAFLVSEDTMTRRLTRAKGKIEQTGLPFGVPEEPWRPERLQGVLGVLYLLFNQGNDAGPDDFDRAGLAEEAIRLTRLVVELLPEPEPAGALALMLLTRSRRPARFDAGGPVTLDLQNRTLWDRGLITEGQNLLDSALARGDPGPYTLQAAIAGCHSRAARAEDTDFGLIAGLYRRLETLNPTPVVRLNRAVAVGLSEGPRAGLALLDLLFDEPTLAGYYLFPAARADFLGKSGRWAESAAAWAEAARLAPSDHERRFLEARRTSALEEALKEAQSS